MMVIFSFQILSSAGRETLQPFAATVRVVIESKFEVCFEVSIQSRRIFI